MKSNVLVELGRKFQKEFKRLQKKHPSLKGDLAELMDVLRTQPKAGTPLGHNTYKIRLAIKSKSKGKSGGARVITYVETEIIGVIENNTVTLLTIYDKAEISAITQEKIQTLVEELQEGKKITHPLSQNLKASLPLV
jgi:mRNA-degrading endonuclease RelE of RelBE toxin-antitoxin system